MKPKSYLIAYCVAAILLSYAAAIAMNIPIFDLISFRSISIPSIDWGGSWVFWAILLAFVAVPALLGMAVDGKGQGASGWILLIGIGLSIFLGIFYLIGLGIWSLVRLVC